MQAMRLARRLGVQLQKPTFIINSYFVDTMSQ